MFCYPGNGIQNRPYHAHISLKQRKEIHGLFVKDLIKVVVATCAFGMGIDKPGTFPSCLFPFSNQPCK